MHRSHFRFKRAPLNLLIALALSAPAVVNAQIAAADKPIAISITSRSLNAALDDLAATTGVPISFSPGLVAGKRAPTVNGNLTPFEAVNQLLVGSGLVAAREGGSLVVRSASPTVGAANGVMLPTVMVTAEAERETATGPVQGYVAKRSATGTKTDTPLIEIPQTISVVTADQIDTFKAQDLSDVLLYTPGVVTSDNGGPTSDMFSMRGFTVTSNEILRDGLRYMVNTFDGKQEPYGLERTEVLKGASSVLYGALAPGGMINTVTKRPTADKIREINFDAGSFNRKQLSGDFAGAITDDGIWSYRVTALQRDSNSFVDHVPDDRTYFAPAVKWQPNANTSLTLLPSYQRQRSAFLYGFPTEGSVINNPNGRIARSRFTGEPGFDKYQAQQYSFGYLFERGLKDNLRLRHGLRYFRSDVDHPSITPSTSFTDDALTKVSRRATRREDKSTGVSADTSLEYKWGSDYVAHQTIAGFDYTLQDYKNWRYRGAASDLNLFSPEYGIPVGELPPQYAAHRKSESIGLYVQDQIKINDKWVVALGGRYDRFRYKEGDLFTYPTDWFIDKEKSSAVTGRAGLVYLAANGLAPFISYSQSFEPTSGTDRNRGRFKPTRGQQFEIGLRYQPKGSETLLSASVYDLTQKDVLTTDPQDVDFQVQLGKSRSKGVELEAKTNIGRNAKVIAAYAYTDARTIKSSPLTPEEEGKRSSQIPLNQLSLWGEYRFADFGLPQLKIGTGVRYIGPMRSLTDTNTESPSYTLLDAVASYTTGPWRLAVNMTNLTDKVYASRCVFRCVYGEPRKVIATVSYRW